MLFTCPHAVISSPSVRQAGVGMIEILVTLVILAIGLLGLAGLHLKANVAEMESYQRAQALALVRGMVDVVQTARGNPTAATRASDLNDSRFSSSDGSVYFGFGDSNGTLCASTNPPSLTPNQQYVCDRWRQALLGAAETTAVNGNVGAMIGARGCLITPAAPTIGAIADFYVVVVWQGLSRTGDPAADTPGDQCARNVNFGTGLRRVASTRVLLPLQN